MNSKLVRTVIIVVIIAFIAIFAVLLTHKHKQQNAQITNAPLPKAVSINTQNQPTLGDPKAAIHIVAFEDLKCVICKGYNLTLFPKIKKQLIDSHIARYTVINLAFVPGSMQAANTARCLYMQKNSYFFQFVDSIYHHQGAENENWATIPVLLKYANMIPGVDADKLSDCVMKSPYTNFIISNLDLAKKAMGKSIGTPSVYINGILVQPLTMPQINKVIAHIKSDKE